MLVNVPEAKSPPLHVYAIGHPLEGCALAILVVPTNPVATAPDDATIMAAPNRIRNFILAPFVCCVSPEAPYYPPGPAHSSLISSSGNSPSRPEKVLASPPYHRFADTHNDDVVRNRGADQNQAIWAAGESARVTTLGGEADTLGRIVLGVG